MVKCRRGDIWFADLGEPRGSEPGYNRPVLVIQDNYFNDSGLNTVVVLGITSNLKFSKVPGNVLITAQESGLDKASVIVVSQLVALDKEWFLHRIGPIPQLTIDLVEHGLGLLLGFK